MVFDTAGRIVASHQTEIPQIYPKAGWAEHDPMIILETCYECIENAVIQMKQKGLDPLQVRSIGITNQRETTCVWFVILFLF